MARGVAPECCSLRGLYGSGCRAVGECQLRVDDWSQTC